MIIIPIQHFGTGDLIYTQTLIHYLCERGDKIIWPVVPHFVEDFNRAYPNITFISKDVMAVDYEDKRDYVKDGCRFIPLRWIDTILKVPYSQCMSSKYKYFDLDYRIWKEKAMWSRDAAREEMLLHELGCHKGPYNLVNKYFGTYSQFQVNVEIDNDLPIVEMKSIPGFSLFDWAQVIENATEIHVASSSILYILELLDIKAKQVDLYVRKPIEKDFATVDYLFEKHKYNFHL